MADSASRASGVARVDIRHLAFRAPPLLDGGRVDGPAGELAQVVNGDEPFRYLAYVEFRDAGGAMRGNHYHEKRVETLYVIRGRLEGFFEDIDSGETARVSLAAGDLVRVEPRCAHAYRPVEPTDAIEFSPHPYEPADTVKHRLALAS